MSNKLLSILVANLTLICTLSGCLSDVPELPPNEEFDDPTPLRINHIQVKGTHNSYHLAPDPATSRKYDYSHEPLDVQAEDFGVRQFEFDVWWHPGSNLKVYHNQYDSGTTCSSLNSCLGKLNTWSDENPTHVPLMIWVEPKDWAKTILDSGVGIEVLDVLKKLESELKSYWPEEKMITPDQVRGDHPNLSHAVTTSGWPLLEESRGKAMFILLAGGEVRSDYLGLFPNLENATMFVMSQKNKPTSAIFSRTDSVGDFEEIQELVEAGYIVRSRADDADDGEADSNDVTRRDAAFNSGAHSIATDYPAKVSGLDYWVRRGVGCNPVTAPPTCTSWQVESLPFTTFFHNIEFDD